MSVTFGNNVQGAFTYNDHLQLSTLRYFNGSTEILNLGYDYTSGVSGNSGQIQKVHYYTTPGVEDLTKSENFTYDQQARLSAAQTGVVNSTSGAKTWSLQWTYDRFGNRLTQQMLAGDPSFPVGQPTLMINAATNQITNSGYTYDYAGNMTHDATAAYAYDGANRLTAINTTGAVYSYFGPDRVKKVLGSTTTRYIYSGTKAIAEYVGTTNPTLSTEYIYAGSQLLVTIAGSTTTYHHPDHLSNRAETNSSGTRTRTFGQLPFGETWYETGTADKWKFTSYERDSGTGETGLDYAQFRYYASNQARFISVDLRVGHIGAPQSLNRYAYVGNDPINSVDPLGLEGNPYCTSGEAIIGRDEWGRGICGIIFEGERAEPDPLGGGGGGGGGADGDASDKLKQLRLNALIKCLQKLFGASLDAYVPSKKGDYGLVNLTTASGNHLFFLNDAGSYSTAGLNMIFYGDSTPPAGRDNINGLTMYQGTFTKWYSLGILGHIPNLSSWKPFDLVISYTANDVNPSEMFGTQIHELGHQVAQTIGLAEKGTEDKYGPGLQDCVNQEMAAQQAKGK